MKRYDEQQNLKEIKSYDVENVKKEVLEVTKSIKKLIKKYEKTTIKNIPTSQIKEYVFDMIKNQYDAI